MIAKIWSLSTSSIVFSGTLAGLVDKEVGLGDGKSIWLIIVAVVSSMLRSIKCSISRILPGQSYLISSWSTLLDTAAIFLPVFFANLFIKCEANKGISSLRSRSGGNGIGNTFKR